MMWERRMAECAAARDVAEKATEDARQEDRRCDTQRPWMNGWPRLTRDTILVATTVACVGCGRSHGITSVAVDPDWEPPPEPSWPFGPDDCPVC